MLVDRARVGLFWLIQPAKTAGCRLQTFGKVNIVEGLAGGELLARAQQVLETQLKWVQAQTMGNRIHVRLIGPGGLGTHRAAIGSSRWQICVHAIRIHLNGRYPIGANTGHHAGPHQDWTDIGISPGAPIECDLPRSQGTVGFKAGFDRNGGRVLGDRYKLLSAGQRQLDRPASCLTGQRCHHRLDAHVSLAALAAAQGWHNEANMLR